MSEENGAPLTFAFWQVEHLSLLLLHVLDQSNHSVYVGVDDRELHLLCFLHDSNNVGRIPLYGLDAHVLLHAFLHERGLRQRLGFFVDHQCVQLGQLRRVLEHLRLLITQVANGVVTLMRIEKCRRFEVGKSVQI